jgi:hypothetical protein
MPQLAGSGQGCKKERNSNKNRFHRDLPFDLVLGQGNSAYPIEPGGVRASSGAMVREGFALLTLTRKTGNDQGFPEAGIASAKVLLRAVEEINRVRVAVLP